MQEAVGSSERSTNGDKLARSTNEHSSSWRMRSSLCALSVGSVAVFDSVPKADALFGRAARRSRGASVERDARVSVSDQQHASAQAEQRQLLRAVAAQ